MAITGGDDRVSGSKEAPGARREPGPARQSQAGPLLPPCMGGAGGNMSLCPGGQGAQPRVVTVASIAQTYGTAWGAAARDHEALQSAHPLLPSTALNAPARATAARGSCRWVPGARPRLCSLQTAPNKPVSASKQDPAGSWKSNCRSQAGERVAPSPQEAPGRRGGGSLAPSPALLLTHGAWRAGRCTLERIPTFPPTHPRQEGRPDPSSTHSQLPGLLRPAPYPCSAPDFLGTRHWPGPKSMRRSVCTYLTAGS